MFGKGFSSLQGKGPTPLIHEGKATRGKYAGQSYEWLLSHKPSYLVYIYENMEDHGLTRAQYKDASHAVEDMEDGDDPYKRHGSSYNEFWGSAVDGSGEDYEDRH